MTILELPLLRKELVGLLRTRKAYWCMRLVLIMSCVFPLFFWPSQGKHFLRGMEGLAAFTAFFVAQMTTALFLVPAFTAGAIAGQRERDTYEMLYSSLLRPSSIVLSKVAVSAGFILLVLVFASPAVLVLYFLGGLTLGSILKCYAVLAAALLLSGVVCIYHSMRSRRTAQAAVSGYVWVFFWNGGLALLAALLWAILTPRRSGGLLGGVPFVPDVLYFLKDLTSPYVPLITTLFEQARPFRPFNLFPIEPWACYVAFAGCVALVHFLLLLRKARTPEPPAAPWRERRKARNAAVSGPIRRSFFTRFLLRAGERGAPFVSNAIFQKEVRSEFFGRRLYRHVVFWLSFFVFAGISYLCFAEREPVGVVAAGVTMAALTLVLLLVPAVAASSFPREAEQGNLDFLRSTHLTWPEIRRGKLRSALWSGWGIVAALAWVLLGVAILTAFSRFPTEPYNRGSLMDRPWLIYVILDGAVLVVALHFAASLATTISALTRRTLGALLATYGLLLAWLVGLPFVVAAASHGGRAAVTFLGVVHPYFAVGVTVDQDVSGSTIVFLIIFTVASLFLGLWADAALEDRYAREP